MLVLLKSQPWFRSVFVKSQLSFSPDSAQSQFSLSSVCFYSVSDHVISAHFQSKFKAISRPKIKSLFAHIVSFWNHLENCISIWKYDTKQTFVMLANYDKSQVSKGPPKNLLRKCIQSWGRDIRDKFSPWKMALKEKWDHTFSLAHCGKSNFLSINSSLKNHKCLNFRAKSEHNFANQKF